MRYPSEISWKLWWICIWFIVKIYLWLQGRARIIVDGRGKTVDGFQDGNWLFPTLIDNINPSGKLAKTEAFGPLLGLLHADDLDQAIKFVNSQSYGNMACLFTTSGAAARKLRYEAEAGNIGINVGVAAPMAFYPFGGSKDSFFGTLHAEGKHGFEFYTQTKHIVERWPNSWCICNCIIPIRAYWSSYRFNLALYSRRIPVWINWVQSAEIQTIMLV